MYPPGLERFPFPPAAGCELCQSRMDSLVGGESRSARSRCFYVRSPCVCHADIVGAVPCCLDLSVLNKAAALTMSWVSMLRVCAIYKTMYM